MQHDTVTALKRTAASCLAAKLCGTRDQNQLTTLFVRELNIRTRAGLLPQCLFIDIEDGGASWLGTYRLGRSTRNIRRQMCRCFANPPCDANECRARAPLGCSQFDGFPELDPENGGERLWDLVMSCHSISFVENLRARCFLNALRCSVKVGGMILISAFGKYSSLADYYPDPDAAISSRFSSLVPDSPFDLAPETRICLYSERELCTTLIEAGWNVIRSSTTTENNVLAAAIRM